MPNQEVIRRGYINIGDSDSDSPRYIHYYTSGTGPALVLLHPSPAAGNSFLPIIERLGEHATTIALDTPGYGLSDALDCPVDDLSPYVGALDAFRDALGIERMTLYGSATGSQIAAEYAKAHPQYCDSLILDNVGDFPASIHEQTVEGYFPDLSVDVSGAHLTRIWTMALDLMRFFPWHRHTDAARLTASDLDPEVVQFIALQFLQAGADYDKAYRVAFINERAERLLPVDVPTTIIRSSGSTVKAYADRFDQYDWPANFHMHHCGGSREERHKAIVDIVAERVAGRPPVDLTTPEYRDGRRIVSLESGNVSLVQTAGAGGPWLILHDIGSSVQAIKHIVDSFEELGAVLAPDLPGHGATDTHDSSEHGYLKLCTEVLGALIDENSLENISIVAIGESAPLALHLCSERGGLVKQIVLLNPLSGSEIIHMQPKLDGSHLTSLWHVFRNRQLYYSTDDWSTKSALKGEPDLDRNTINQQLIDFLCCRHVYSDARRACDAFPIADAIAACSTDIKIARTMGTTSGDRSLRNFGSLAGSNHIDLPVNGVEPYF